ncbi:MAG: nitrous oxide reductase family maturation protein NosD [Chloroflexi bacterium]|nr:nitrous oxide reductase family maturation protein NosD [Chloroflexota bacterium]
MSRLKKQGRWGAGEQGSGHHLPHPPAPLLLILLLLLLVPTARAQSELVVAPDGPYATIPEALAAAQDGDTILVRGGQHEGNLTVDKSIRLIGQDWPVIDGGGKGMVVTLAAPSTQFSGFVVRGSGNEPDRNHAGINVAAENVLVENNRLEEVLFGISFANADGGIARGNEVTGKAEYDSGRKGDAIRVWYSRDVLIEGNLVHDTRDMVAWYSEGVIIRGNTLRDNRYGVHLMYCDGAIIEDNTLLDNSVGIYTMYTNNVTLANNLIRGQRGPSGYALGFKDADNVTVTGNVLVDNRVGIFLDGAPFSPQGTAEFHDNILVFNDIGLVLQPAVRGAVFSDNTFWENSIQMTLAGGGRPGSNEWAGNFWSDYAGFDADGDGRGDLPYQSDRFFEGLTDREPRLQMLAYSPAIETIEFAARSFPIIKPQPKLTDPAPLMAPAPLPAFAQTPMGNSWPILGTAVALLALAGTIYLTAGKKEHITVNSEQLTVNGGSPAPLLPRSPAPHLPGSPAPIAVSDLSKRYGKTEALHEVSFTAVPGEILALWGANGAGKTTLLKAILGLIRFEGEIAVGGHDVARAGKAARRSIGYVPQEAVFYDWGVLATMRFYARLKKASPERIPFLLRRLGLEPHAHKAVAALSGGLKQRLALAIALLSDPPLLLLDEPTASLDTATQQDYLTLLSDLRAEGKTILFASHRLEEVEALADRALLLENGRLVDIFPADQLRARIAPTRHGDGVGEDSPQRRGEHGVLLGLTTAPLVRSADFQSAAP